MTKPIPASRRTSLASSARLFFASKLELFGAAGWVTVAFVLQQALRLASSIALAWLLAPALLGTMVLINTLRTGVELLSDVGIGQSIINNPRGDEPAFYHTAWTLQIARGVILTLIAFAISGPLAAMYDNTQLENLLLFVAPIFIISGLMSTARFQLEKRLEVRKVATFDLGLAAVSTVIHIAFAAYSQTIWALVWALLLTTAISTAASFFLISGRKHRLQWDADAAKSILHFGKWIFVSTLIYFIAMNFDRLYFADAIPLVLFGVYGVARTFSEAIMLLFQRIGNMMIFPRISASRMRGTDLRRSIGPMRMVLLLGIAFGLAATTSVADIFIDIAFDERYQAAGFFLTVLLFGTWFSTLSAISESILMGVGKPASVAFGNGAKLLVVVILLPSMLATFGINAALAAFVVAEVVRYAMLMWQKHKQHIGFARQDAIATAIFFVLVFGFRELSMLVGLTGGVSEWIIQAGLPHV